MKFILLLLLCLGCHCLPNFSSTLFVTSVKQSDLFGACRSTSFLFLKSNEELSYTRLPHTCRKNSAATTVEDLALFAGGSIDSDDHTVSDAVDIYDIALEKWQITRLSTARTRLVATSLGHQAFFAGGGSNASFSDVVDIFNTVTGNWAIRRLSEPRWSLTAASANGLALFAGGYGPKGPSRVVDIYSQTTGDWYTAELSLPRFSLASAISGEKFFFAGGITSKGASDRVDIYNSLLTKWSIQYLSVPRTNFAATSLGNLVLFAGGSEIAIMDAYDTDLEEWDTSNQYFLAKPSYGLAAVTVNTEDGEKALFAEFDGEFTVLAEYSDNPYLGNNASSNCIYW
jgi:hypothetical protein